MNYKPLTLNLIRQLVHLTNDFEEASGDRRPFTLGEVLYSALRYVKKKEGDAKFLLSLTDEEIHNAFDRAVEHEKEHLKEQNYN